MLSDSAMRNCLAALQAMPSQFRWRTESYAKAMRNWWDSLAEETVEEAQVFCVWRPTVAELYGIAGRVASPTPNEGDLWNEFWYRICTAGSFTEPKWSHPILYNCVRRLGGWRTVGGNLPHLSSTYSQNWWFTRFMEAWNVCRGEWERQVILQLKREHSLRDLRYFENHPLFIPPDLAPESDYEVFRAPVNAVKEPCPAEVRDLVLSSCGKLGIRPESLSEVFE